MKVCLVIIILLPLGLFAQTDWVKWGEKEVSYELPRIEGKDYTLERSNFFASTVSVFKNAYYFLVSDLDGDNCTFHPTCSYFFVDAVKETNIFQGALMFADRFTRDLNFLKREKYALHKSGKFFDPVKNYKLKPNEIKVFPSNKIVTE